ncbi:pyrimidine 5'-nucleotidase [Vibrio hippocampi]|uniref:Pyrimidine 5'-nucleotidase YjjG n=1 Tax=Vibrio hippocampi TaxID=654686 RepID=A0ABN8DL61_9VIBR|nr:pyrimidine 5'-nucleotidase [Vibrio hippocampi]CAH0530117.1 Pyrimidine 5'-nucleotidase YjjG [Vibrio hippocampi]
MKYDWILFDADETLFHFDAFRGMQVMFKRFGIDFTEKQYADYQLVNKPLWVDYQDGKISAEQLKVTRFQGWADKLNVTPKALNSAFLEAMADICTLLPGASELIEALTGQAKLGIITNGFTELQQIRLDRTGMSDYFEYVVISEEVGVAKPDGGIFAHAHQLMGNPCKSTVLMVGDNPHSDVLGGMNFGIDTCWLNTQAAQRPEGIAPSYEVSSLQQLQRILLA